MTASGPCARKWPQGAVGLRAWGAAGLLAALAACQGPPVQVRAVWVDQSGEALHQYDRGTVSDLAFEALPVGGEEHARMQLGPKGRLLFVRPGPEDRGGQLWDLAQDRKWELAVPPLRPGADDPVSFSPRGDAMFWVGKTCIGAACTPDSLWAFAVGPERRLPEGAHTWDVLAAGPLSRYARVLPAADAPVLFTVAEGEVAAWRYPTRADEASELVRIDQREIEWAPTTRSSDRCPFPDWCGTRAAVSPDGDAAFFMVSLQTCESGLMRWVPGEIASCEPYVPELVGASLLAALSAEVLVFSDDTRLYMHKRGSRPLRRLPVLGEGDYFTAPAQDGRALVFGAFDGPVLRASLSGLEIISTGTTRCSDPDAPIVSPKGDWVAWTCGRAPDVQLGENFASAVVRVHDGELERHPGVAAWPLGIDGDGDLLFVTTDQSSEDIPEDLPFPLDGGDELSSGEVGFEWGEGGEDWGETTGAEEEGDTGETGGATGGPGDLNDPLGAGSLQALPPRPRTMYTLSADGVIRRVSDMEPTPVPTKLGEAGVSQFVQVGG